MRTLASHQNLMVDFAIARNGKCGLFCEPRTGKTAATLEILKKLKAQRVLIMCPKSVAGVWQEEAQECDFHLPVSVVVDGNLTERAQALKSWMALRPYGAISINYDSFWNPKLAELLVKWAPDALVADEIQMLKHRTSRRSKFAHRLAALPTSRIRLGLTGTPVTNGNQDLFSIYKFIDPSVFGNSYSHFERDFLVTASYGGFSQIVGSRNEEEARRRVRETAIQISRSEAWGGMPKRFDQPTPALLTKESTNRYVQFRKDSVTKIEGIDETGAPVNTRMVATLRVTQLIRLHQLVSGHTVVDNTTVDVSSEKIDAAIELTDIAHDNGDQVVIACAFRREIARIYERLAKKYPGKVAAITGKTSGEERDAIRRNFQKGILTKLVGQDQIIARGIDLSAANVGIIVSTGYDLEIFDQLRNRLTGIDPNREFAYYYLQAQLFDGKPTVDRTIYNALRNKQNIASRIIDLDYARNLIV